MNFVSYFLQVNSKLQLLEELSIRQLLYLQNVKSHRRFDSSLDIDIAHIFAAGETLVLQNRRKQESKSV